MDDEYVVRVPYELIFGFPDLSDEDKITYMAIAISAMGFSIVQVSLEGLAAKRYIDIQTARRHLEKLVAVGLLIPHGHPNEDTFEYYLPSRVFTGVEDSWVYFIGTDDHTRIKIGCSTDPKRRRTQLQSGRSSRLSIIGTIRGGAVLEAEMHERFKAQRVKGEWFAWEGELAEFVANKFGEKGQ